MIGFKLYNFNKKYVEECLNISALDESYIFYTKENPLTISITKRTLCIEVYTGLTTAECL